MYNDIQKYKILYTENARERLHNFLTFMRSNCKYFDSGLHNEFEMIENYIKRYDDFVDDILNIIEDRFKEGVLLLGRKVDEVSKDYEMSKITFSLRSFNIIVKCKQIFDTKIIEIEDITIRNG